MMKLSVALAVSVLLAGCAPAYGPEPGPGPGPYYGGGAYVVGEPIAYDGFYDDYYGPFYDGYWARDGYYYYRRGPEGRFQPDRGNHFRHETHDGFHAVHGGNFRGGGGEAAAIPVVAAAGITKQVRHRDGNQGRSLRSALFRRNSRRELRFPS